MAPATAVAVALVVAFMLVTYGRFGFYANLAVIINAELRQVRRERSKVPTRAAQL